MQINNVEPEPSALCILNVDASVLRGSPHCSVDYMAVHMVSYCRHHITVKTTSAAYNSLQYLFIRRHRFKATLPLTRPQTLAETASWLPRVTIAETLRPTWEWLMIQDERGRRRRKGLRCLSLSRHRRRLAFNG